MVEYLSNYLMADLYQHVLNAKKYQNTKIELEYFNFISFAIHNFYTYNIS